MRYHSNKLDCIDIIYMRSRAQRLTMKRVTIEMSNDDHKKMKLLSYTEDISLSELLKRAVKEYISTNNADLIDIIDNR